MNYTQLVNEIQNYTENQFTTTDINTFIQQAEQRIYNSVQFPSLRRNVLGSTYANNKYLSAPNDFLAVYSIAVVDGDGNYQYLLNKDVNFIRAAFPNPNDSGLPEYYALFGPTTTQSLAITNELSFLLGPMPDDAYTIELHYYYYPESITTVASGQTWLGDNFDSVLLYGSLLEAYTYMKGEADVYAAYQQRYNDALAMAKRLGDGMERGDAYRDGQYKQKVV